MAADADMADQAFIPGQHKTLQGAARGNALLIVCFVAYEVALVKVDIIPLQFA